MHFEEQHGAALVHVHVMTSHRSVRACAVPSPYQIASGAASLLVSLFQIGGNFWQHRSQSWNLSGLKAYRQSLE
jgi:hypothetical protein